MARLVRSRDVEIAVMALDQAQPWVRCALAVAIPMWSTCTSRSADAGAITPSSAVTPKTSAGSARPCR